MEVYKISKAEKKLNGTIHLTASKSESNRALIIQALCEGNVIINNLAQAEDTQRLRQLLNFDSEILNVGAAGTSMRFLAAFLACKEGSRILTGSERMKQRPIKILVDALRELGAEIEYLEKEGFPPLSITGKKLTSIKIKIEGNISSQYISALLLIGPYLPDGLTLDITGQLISKPYIKMTVEMMKYFGASVDWTGNSIKVSGSKYKEQSIFIEADWSAASYWYEMAALAEKVDLHITGLRKNSLQGDAIVAEIYESFGVKTTFTNEGIHLKKCDVKNNFDYDFTNCPDLAQTVAVTMGALKINGTLSGLQSLKIKETDRLEALKIELNKIGVATEINENTLIVLPNSSPITNSVQISTYGDHRMAMAFAPLALKTDAVEIENPEVVSKSYPDFWTDLKSVGFEVSKK